jgi:hypothetical protein
MHTIHMKIGRSLNMFKDAIGILSVVVADLVIIAPKQFGT